MIRWEANANGPGLVSLYLGAMDALYAIHPSAMFFVEGAGQAGLGCCWGDGFCTDAGTIAANGLSDPRPFFDGLLGKPYVNQARRRTESPEPKLCCRVWMQLMVCWLLDAPTVIGTVNSMIPIRRLHMLAPILVPCDSEGAVGVLGCEDMPAQAWIVCRPPVCWGVAVCHATSLPQRWLCLEGVCLHSSDAFMLEGIHRAGLQRRWSSPRMCTA